ncbi:hypothetical protein OPW13_06990 [Vibrio europaeus]|uniref:Uncharacterized protein n=1 Tax=Vibrio europaeus TaxID=300876 RepID=A0A178J9A8_9VIBR|nr:hypothetical protein [Vibrio europaeus]MDC5704751.1 hypothetical protein [Vibrio europaeus]MDC5710030.1 hypothetical protein [Vibrio europaeus]MDC5715120.1 hypothetical protein [Vibrio europaeus]MDC5719026.1 hypothetical protein [Vibrio europaeus]MDC5844148.1 hypothetical protein [Vibrio europaeus]
MYKNLVNYIKQVRLVLNLIFIVTMVFIVLNAVIFSQLPELFNGGSALLGILNDISVGYIVSYIFYFLVVHIKEVDDKKHINFYIAAKSQALVSEYKGVVSHLKRSKDSTSHYLLPEEFNEIFSQISPQSPSSFFAIHGRLPWIEVLNGSRIRSEKIISKIYLKMVFLDSKYVNLLSRIEESPYFKLLEPLDTLKAPIGNKDMLIWSAPFYQYSLLIKELESYCQDAP